MIGLYIGIAATWAFLFWLTLGICRVGALADERMEREFQQFLRDREDCSQKADGLLHEEGTVNG